MWDYLLGALALGALCSAWALIQGWITDQDPEVRGPESGCHGCGGCTGSCDSPDKSRADPIPQATARPKPH